MKQKTIGLMILIIWCFTAQMVYAKDISVNVNGAGVQFDVPPVIEKDRVLVPMRAIFEAIGGEVQWDGNLQLVVGQLDNHTVIFKINQTEALVDGLIEIIEVAPTIKEGRTFLPLRFLSEKLGLKVNWDGSAQVVSITSTLKELPITTGEIKNNAGKITYKGQLKGEIPYGKGQQFEEEKLIYDGEFVNGKYQGYGIQYDAKTGKVTYEGQYKAGIPHGKGIKYNAKGQEVYNGSFVEGFYEGEGKRTEYTEEGTIAYEGTLHQNIAQGKGKIYLNGRLWYEGTFQNDELDGQGIEYYKDKVNKILYIGEFKVSQYNGTGKYYNEYGNLEYDGEWVEGKFEGYGKLYYETGNIAYEGRFIFGQKQGQGKLYARNGTVVYEGKFVNDAPSGN